MTVTERHVLNELVRCHVCYEKLIKEYDKASASPSYVARILWPALKENERDFRKAWRSARKVLKKV